MPLAAGRRDARIELHRAHTLKNGLNEDVPTWTMVGKRWAERLDASDGERLRAAEVGATITTRFRVLRDSLTRTITPKDRIVMRDSVGGDRVFDISGVKDLNGGEGLEITAAARTDLDEAES